MKTNKLLIFSLITLAVIVAASVMTRQRAPETSVQKQLLFPGLQARLNDVSKLSMEQQGRVLTLQQVDKQWQIAEADNYPADFGKIRETVISLADLQILAEKTGNAELYPRLGVQEPDADNADALLLSLYAGDGSEMASVIVGKPRHSKSADDKPGLYVRLPDAAAALLVEGRLDLSADVQDWFNRELFNIKKERIKNIEITHGDEPAVRLSRESDIDDFVLEDLPDNLEMQSDVIISRMATILEDIFVENVISAEKMADEAQIKALIHTFDGLVAEIDSAVINDENYARFSFSVDESVTNEQPEPAEEDEAAAAEAVEKPDVVAEAAALNEQLAGWAYAIPDFKFELFTRKLSQLSKEKSADTTTTSE